MVYRRASDSTPKAPDTIMDADKYDRLDLNQFDMYPRTKKVDRFRYWLGYKRFTGRRGELRFNRRRGSYDGDINGDKKANFRVRIRVQSPSGAAVQGAVKPTSLENLIHLTAPVEANHGFPAFIRMTD